MVYNSSRWIESPQKCPQCAKKEPPRRCWKKITMGTDGEFCADDHVCVWCHSSKAKCLEDTQHRKTAHTLTGKKGGAGARSTAGKKGKKKAAQTVSDSESASTSSYQAGGEKGPAKPTRKSTRTATEKRGPPPEAKGVRTTTATATTGKTTTKGKKKEVTEDKVVRGSGKKKDVGEGEKNAESVGVVTEQVFEDERGSVNIMVVDTEPALVPYQTSQDVVGRSTDGKDRESREKSLVSESSLQGGNPPPSVSVTSMEGEHHIPSDFKIAVTIFFLGSFDS